MKKWTISIVVFSLTIIPMVAISIILAYFLVGPHSGILLEKFQLPVYILLCVLSIGLPAWAAYKTYVKFDIKMSKLI